MLLYNYQPQVVYETKNTGQVARIEGFIGGTASNPTKQWQQRMSYDSLGRLSKVAEYQGTTSTLSYKASYTYDVYGNRYQYASQNSTAGQADPQPYVHVEDSEISKTTNRFISTGTTPMFYDAAGNLVEDRKFRQMQYRYDANGRQRWAKQINNNSEVTSLYDGVGQRVATQINTEGWQYLVYDIFGQLVAEYGGATSAESGVRFIMADHQGSERAVMNSSGAVLARRDYLAFGEEIQAGTGMRTTAQGYGATDQTRQRYDGMERDVSSSGLDHTLWRKYDSSAGRWTSPDSYTGNMNLGDSQSLNRYTYVHNDPVNFVDPSGLVESWSPCSAQYSFEQCGGGAAFWGGGPFGDDVARHNEDFAGLTEHMMAGFQDYRERLGHARAGDGFFTDEELRDVPIQIEWGVDEDGNYWARIITRIWVDVGDGTNPFNLMGTNDQWPPQWPGDDGTYGWGERTPHEKIIRTPDGPIETVPQTGKPGIEVDPNKPVQRPFNPEEIRTPENATTWQTVKAIIGAGLRILGEIFGGAGDFIVVPNPNLILHEDHPAAPPPTE